MRTGRPPPGRFAQTDPSLGDLVRSDSVPAHFALAGHWFGNVARRGFVPAHFGWAGLAAGPAALPFAHPLLWHLEPGASVPVPPAMLDIV